MESLIRACGLLCVLGGCGAVGMDGRPELVPVAGEVRGLWDGADGVVLRLEAKAADIALTVPANGAFQFDPGIASGLSYTVTIMSNPTGHACTIDAGGNGTAGAGTAVSVACRGPSVAITASGPWQGQFDPDLDTQMLSASVVQQDATVTVSGDSLMGATIQGVSVPPGQPSAPLALALGMTTVPVAVTARGGLSKTYQLVFQRGPSAIAQIVYGKSSNTRGNSGFAAALAIDGDTLAVGAPCESSNAKGINAGNPDDTSAACAGAVYVFVRSGGVWAQQAYVKPSNTEAGDGFGSAVALSGNTLAVGATGEDSAANQINGNQGDNLASEAGAVYVFVRDGTTWSQQAYLKAPNAGAGDNFGSAVALSGNTLAVGATGEDSAANQINGNQADDTAPNAGAVYVFVRSGETWEQQAYLKAANGEAQDELGFSVALVGDTLVAGAPGEASAVAAGADPANNAADAAGAVYVFVRAGAAWSQQAYLKASNPGKGDFFGCSVALAPDTLAVGAYQESSTASGVDHDQANDGALNAGAAYVFVRSGGAWQQQAYVKASNTQSGDLFGWSVALSGDTLVAGAYHEASAATGLDGDQNNNALSGAGAAYVFMRSGASWEQRAYVKASNTGMGDLFGWAVAVSPDTLVVAAQGEASAASGINPTSGERDNGAADAGAVYLFQ
jgi:hypothetical protein